MLGPVDKAPTGLNAARRANAGRRRQTFVWRTADSDLFDEGRDILLQGFFG